MQSKSQSGTDQENQFFSQKSALRLIVIGFLFIAALVIRLHNITAPPLDFAPGRQYFSANFARAYYFETSESIPEWRKQVSRATVQKQLSLEPRIMEHAAVLGYRIVGGEHLWVPRLLSSIFWVIGGAFLYLIAKKIVSIDAAIFSTAFYLFLPFGISASRSFQPDSLMVMMLLFSLFLILRYYEQTSISRLLIAANVSALAMFIIPLCLFLIFGAFISLAVYRRVMNRTGLYQGIWKSVLSKDFLIFTVVSLCPTIIYYGYGTFIARGDLYHHLQGTFFPQLLLELSFWKKWLIMIGRAIGYTALIGAIIGFFMFRQGYSKALLAGLYIGYFIYGIFATFHIKTHDYYQLQFIPVVALSLGPIGALAINQLRKRWYVIALAAVFLTAVIGAGFYTRHIHLKDIYINYKSQLKVLGPIIGVNPQFKDFLFNDFKREVRIAKEIGEIVGHSTRTIYLDSHNGVHLQFHGELYGSNFPKGCPEDPRERGHIPKTEELFSANYFVVRDVKHRGKYIKYIPQYFIVTDFKMFDEKTVLKDFLIKNFPILVQNNDYLIFDLRKMSDRTSTPNSRRP